MQYATSSFPAVSRNAPDILRLFGPESDSIQRTAQRALQVKQPVAGLDLEFTGDTPTVLGVSDGSLTVSVSWAEGLPYLRELLESHPDIIWVGHAIVSADLFVLRAVGIDLKLTNLQDTIIWHWLNNANLCKGTGKVEDNDGTAKGRGYMNLWTFASLYASYPNWKICKESECDGTYCPEHDMYGYNGADSQIPLVALAPAVMQSRLRGTTHLYDLHRELMYVLTDMSRYGIQTDGPYIETLREELTLDRERVAKSLTFSPTSPKQVVEHFKSKGIRLADAQETTVREACEEYDDPELHALLEFKELGNGPDRWFGDRFVDAGGRVHPRISIFTSSARMMCSGPNFQNLGHWRVNRRQCECGHRVEGHSDGIAACSECSCAKFKPVNIGGKVRRGVVASSGTYLAKFDLKNGEGRVMFHFAGIQVPADAHTFTADLCKLTDDMEYCRREGGRRQAAKKIVHASSYLEGIQLKTATELRSANIQKEISYGARVVYSDWTFEEKIVTFTGANFSQRVWGDKTLANRKKTIDLIEGQYFANIPAMREFQKRITGECERHRAIMTPLGYYISSYGQAEDRMKTCAAVHGSQPVGHLTKIGLVRAARAHQAGRPMRPLLQEHDSILYEVAEHVPSEQAVAWMHEDGVVEMPEIPGLTIPLDCGVSLPTANDPSNWRDIH